MVIRRVYSPASMRIQKSHPKKYFVSYCIMDGGLGFGHACLVLSELDTNNPNANVRVDSAYGFYSLSKTMVSKVFGFDPVSVGQIKKEDLRDFVMPDANYAYNFELTEAQMKALKSKLEARMKMYNELIPKAKKMMKSKEGESRISDIKALEFIKRNPSAFPEIQHLKSSDLKPYNVLKNNCVIQAQEILSDIGLKDTEEYKKSTQQKFLSSKDTKTKYMKKVNMTAVGGSTKSYNESFSVFTFNPVQLVKNLISKHKGTLPKGKRVEYKKWQTTSKDIESAKMQYLKQESPELYSLGMKLLKKYDVPSFDVLHEVITKRKRKSQQADLKDASKVLEKWHSIDQSELIKKKLLHIEAEAFWTDRFEYIDSHGTSRDLWAGLSSDKTMLINDYKDLIRILKERMGGIIQNTNDKEMHVNYLDAAALALSQVDMSSQKLANILENVLNYHDDVLKDECKQDVLTTQERSNLKKDLEKVRENSKKSDTTPTLLAKGRPSK